jgi:hypothetical protein
MKKIIVGFATRNTIELNVADDTKLSTLTNDNLIDMVQEAIEDGATLTDVAMHEGLDDAKDFEIETDDGVVYSVANPCDVFRPGAPVEGVRRCDYIVTLLREQLAQHIHETNGLIAANDAKSAASHAHDEAMIRASIQILEAYAADRDE